MTILVVDDHEQNRYQLQVLLGGNGYQVVTAANGVEALAEARQNPPDLIVSDILMPGMDGFSLCREWKKDERLKSIPFVFYTATYTDDRDRDFALGLGADRFLVKPVEPEVFLETIRGVLLQGGCAPAAPGQPAGDAAARLPVEMPPETEAVYLKEYNEVLVRKLERKMQQLEQTNRELERDIAERKQAEKALLESEERFRLLFEQAADSILLLDIVPEGIPVIRDANRATFRLLGYERDELIGQPVSFIEPAPDALKLVDERRGNILSGIGTVFEASHRCKDGTIREFECSAAETQIGSKIFAISVERDITERKQAEARMAEQLDELRRWHDATVGREGRVLELKREVNELLAGDGQQPRYPSALEEK
jgi:PAS domain S-box-containing protein